MDLDRFLSTNSATWAQLEQLLRRTGNRPSRLSAAELDDLVRLYQLVNTHLSYAATNFSDPGLTSRLSGLVAHASSLIYGTRTRTLRGFGLFFTETLPAALWYHRRFTAVSAVLLLAPALAVGLWLANSPSAVNASAPAAVRQAYINHDFASYYRSAPAAQFATQVYTNNVVVAALAFAGGIVLCLPTILVLIQNGANLGVAAGLFSSAGRTSAFYGLVLPHGLIELTSVVIAGAAGLSVGWAIVSPGDRTRRMALAEQARRCVVLLLGTVVTLAIAGSIEGFVTGSGLPTWLRVGIGVTVEVGFLLYTVVLGRRAAARGLTGQLGEQDRPVFRPALQTSSA